MLSRSFCTVSEKRSMHRYHDMYGIPPNSDFRDEYGKLYDFVTNKKLRVKNIKNHKVRFTKILCTIYSVALV